MKQLVSDVFDLFWPPHEEDKEPISFGYKLGVLLLVFGGIGVAFWIASVK